MDILYVDDKLCVCVKPAGVVSTDQPGGLPDLVREALGREGQTLYTVHRLDQVVGGAMVLARTRHAARDLSQQFARHTVEKEYWAVVQGLPPQEGQLCDLLGRDGQSNKTFIAQAPGPNVRESRLDYVRLDSREGCSLLQIALHTGRSHQIRCQLAAHGYPLAGDVKYGGAPADHGVALWSHRLAFVHPKSGKAMTFTVKPPSQPPWALFLPREG